MPVGLNGDLELGADGVGRRHQDGIGKARTLEVEQAAEAADLGIRAGPRGRPHQRLDQLDQAVAGIDIDAGVRIGQAVLALGHDGWLRRIWRSRNGSRVGRKNTM